jgi:cell pole-organizing protein PopZ
MTDQPAQEPTMEEILASIRRIISEDDAPVAAAEPEAEAEAAPEPAPEPVAAAPAPAPVEDDVLELTETYDAPAEESIGDLDVSSGEDEPDPFPSTPLSESFPEPVPAPAPTPAPAYNTLVGDSAAASAASAFAGLASAARRPTEDAPAVAGPTIDELARSLLRPMLKEWLDAHLPGIVEAEVRKEVERIARNAG